MALSWDAAQRRKVIDRALRRVLSIKLSDTTAKNCVDRVFDALEQAVDETARLVRADAEARPTPNNYEASPW